MNDDNLTIGLVGDVMLGRLVNKVLYYQPPDYPWGDTLPLFHASHFNLCNLECVVSDRGRPWALSPKMFHFRTDAKNVEVLQKARIKAVSIANNHVLDFEDEALMDMLQILDRAGIVHAGSGLDLTEAARPVTVQVRGRRIGLIAFTDNEPMWEAEEDKPGLFHVPIDPQDSRAQRLFDDVRRARESVDVLIVSAHWGGNWGYEPEPEHIPFAHQIIDCGADMVFGHSPHVFRGVELYKDKPILYGTGDFIDDYAVDEIEKNDESFIFFMDFAGGKPIRIRMIPTLIREFQARRALNRKAREIAEKIRNLCVAMGTMAHWREDEGFLEIRIVDSL